LISARASISPRKPVPPVMTIFMLALFWKKS
jgi:hypothetical protein